MQNYYSISIPKPCHENWDNMTPKNKGRFCNSCAKTVIDFTKMDICEIQDFIDDNKSNRICGHFKQSQLDSINIHIPSRLLEQGQSFHKTFLLALFIVMGTTLMNCSNKNGNKQKIDSIEIIDTLNNNRIDILGGIEKITETDSVQNKTCKTKPEEATIIDIVTDGELIIETVGNLETIERPIISIDSLDGPEPPEFDGGTEIMGIMIPDEEIDEDIVFGMITVETPPEFPRTPKSLSKREKKDYFSKQISSIVSKNFNTSVCLDLKGRQRINVQFKIDENGGIIDIKVRAPHKKLEDEAIRVIKLLPQFIPAKQSGKAIKMVYTLPIIFQVEE